MPKSDFLSLTQVSFPGGVLRRAPDKNAERHVQLLRALVEVPRFKHGAVVTNR